MFRCRCFPPFPVVVGATGGPGAGSEGGVEGGLSALGDFHLSQIVHGEQGVELFGALPTSGDVIGVSRVTGIYDKGSGALVAMESEATDPATGDLRWKSRMSIFVKGEGGFGGDRGPSAAAAAPPARSADHVVVYQTRVDQTLLYRLSGDRNPLHSDPSFAKMAGFDRPINHGLNTFGFTGRALLHRLCGSDPARFRGMDGRFSAPCYPGDTLTIRIWVTEPGRAVFTTETQRGEIVLDRGVCTFDPVG